MAQVFSCEFCEISKNTFFTEHIWVTASVFVIKNFQSVAILHEMLEILILTFCNFNTLFFPKYFPLQYSTQLWLSKDTNFINLS